MKIKIEGVDVRVTRGSGKMCVGDSDWLRDFGCGVNQNMSLWLSLEFFGHFLADVSALDPNVIIVWLPVYISFLCSLVA